MGIEAQFGWECHRQSIHLFWHLAEEVWSILGNSGSIALAPWPPFDESMLQEDSHEYPVMINGKLRFKIVLPLNMEAEEIREQVRELKEGKK